MVDDMSLGFTKTIKGFFYSHIELITAILLNKIIILICKNKKNIFLNQIYI